MSATSRNKVTTSMSGDTTSDRKIAQLEILVDELIKDSPHEPRIRSCMEAVGLKYTVDPIARMNTVLSALDGVRAPEKTKRREIEEQT